ncbi:hypothetical protein SEVIR_9G308400v4 [Setaria viridis]|uniref:VQ domain-containing protein n=2 Tax=Setaria TaxID=4554 RepID=K4AJ59_SETIT|nr:hypothetical protein SETIT_9G302500v2 [Setaria italica]TKV94636.1 hypothetical protein SEVIR_9G308400v2 [Setaria viridis]
MESSSNKNLKQRVDDAACSGKPARTHWRRRDPADTSVYVVHPTQFRAVVQQLTGAGAASSPPPAAHHHQGGNGATAAQQTQSAVATGAIGAQQHGSRGEENNSSRRTLGQILDECMAWASAADD